MKYLLSFLVVTAVLQPAYSADFLVSNNSPDHSLATDANSIQYAINSAALGDRVILTSNASYFIKNRLTLKKGVQLVGKKGDPAFPLQQITAYSSMPGSFPISTEMIKLNGGSLGKPGTLQSLVFDGANIACIIVKAEFKSNHLLKNCIFRNTRNNFSANPSNKPWWDVSILFFNLAHFITIDSCELRNAGLGETTGKINPYAWNGFGAGMKFYGCNFVTVKNSSVIRTLTEGIRLSGATNVIIENNTITRPGMNNEWDDGQPNQGLILASGITGYHNQAAKKSNCELSQNWQILNNRFFWCYNNAMSLSGKGFVVTGNRVNYSIQHCLFLGDWRNCSATELYGRERVTQCTISNNDFENAFYDLSQWSWVFNRGTLSYQRPEPEFRKALRINGIVNNDSSVIISNNNLHGQQPFYEYGLNDQGTSCVCPVATAKNNMPVNEAFNLTISPNPAQSFIRVNQMQNSTIAVYKSSGVLKIKTKQNTIDISAWEKGLYYVRCGNASAWFIKE